MVLKSRQRKEKKISSFTAQKRQDMESEVSIVWCFKMLNFKVLFNGVKCNKFYDFFFVFLFL